MAIKRFFKEILFKFLTRLRLKRVAGVFGDAFERPVLLPAHRHDSNFMPQLHYLGEGNAQSPFALSEMVADRAASKHFESLAGGHILYGSERGDMLDLEFAVFGEQIDNTMLGQSFQFLVQYFTHQLAFGLILLALLHLPPCRSLLLSLDTLGISLESKFNRLIFLLG